MKNLCILILFVVFSNTTFSQTFEYQFAGDGGRIYQVSANEFVYGIQNDSLRKFDVYTLDHQLITSIPLPPYDLYFGVMHLSKTLFNTDQKFELLYSYQNMNPDGFGVRVVNEDDSVIFEAPDFWGVLLYNTQAGAKMILSYASGISKLNVYSLSGTVLETEEPGYNEESQIFPNPTDGLVNIVFDSPLKESNLVLSIYTVQGILVDQRNVVSGQRNISFDVSGLSSGTYLYRIHNKSFSTLTKKFIVEK